MANRSDDKGLNQDSILSAKYSVRLLIGSLWANINVISKTE